MSSLPKKRVNTQVKICGLSDAQSIDAAIAGGANYIGFIFFEKSPRNISPRLAAELASPIIGKAVRVAVSVSAGNEFLDEIVEEMKPDMLQLHGSETPQRVEEIKHRYDLPTMKAFAIRQASDFDAAAKYSGIADWLLFDAKPPVGSELPGGNGVAFDWNLFAKWQDEQFSPMQGTGCDNLLDSASLAMLSGGINIDNITEALVNSNARAIDISSGVEKAPGVKDPALIAALLERVADFDAKREYAR